jgi:hypothetical protein
LAKYVWKSKLRGENATPDDMRYLEIVGDLQERGVGDDGALDDVVECKVKNVTT